MKRAPGAEDEHLPQELPDAEIWDAAAADAADAADSAAVTPLCFLCVAVLFAARASVPPADVLGTAVPHC